MHKNILSNLPAEPETFKTSVDVKTKLYKKTQKRLKSENSNFSELVEAAMIQYNNEYNARLIKKAKGEHGKTN